MLKGLLFNQSSDQNSECDNEQFNQDHPDHRGHFSFVRGMFVFPDCWRDNDLFQQHRFDHDAHGDNALQPD